MTKKRKRPRMVITTQQRPWGATKQAADAFERNRDLKNRIAELEDQITVLGGKNHDWYPTGTEIAALGAVVNLPMARLLEFVSIECAVPLIEMHKKLTAWNRDRLAASGRVLRSLIEVGDKVQYRAKSNWIAAEVIKVAPTGAQFRVECAYGTRDLRKRDEGKTWKRAAS